MARSSLYYLFPDFYEPWDGKLVVLEEYERRLCSRLEETEVLVVEKGLLFRINTRAGLVIVYPWWLDGERVKAGTMTLPEKCSRVLAVHCQSNFRTPLFCQCKFPSPVLPTQAWLSLTMRSLPLRHLVLVPFPVTPMENKRAEQDVTWVWWVNGRPR